MKKNNYFCVGFFLTIALCCFSCEKEKKISEKEVPIDYLTMSTNVRLFSEQEAIEVCDSLYEKIILTFNAPIEEYTIQNGIFLKKVMRREI